MKLILAIVRAEDAPSVTTALNESGFRVTRIATQGAWLRKENSTLLIGVEDNQVERAFDIIQRTGGLRVEDRLFPGNAESGIPPMQVQNEVGGATLFLLDVIRNERL